LLEFWLDSIVFLLDLELLARLLMEESMQEVRLLMELFILLAKFDDDDFFKRLDSVELEVDRNPIVDGFIILTYNFCYYNTHPK
jgi:hypothetical protein